MIASSDITLASSTLSLSPLRNNPILYAQTQKRANERVEAIKASFTLASTRYWLHISMPHFFEAIEEVNKPSLALSEYLIESSSQVKGFNCSKGMNLNLNLNQSLKEARTLYPNAEVLKCNYQLYLEYTKRITKVLMAYDKSVQRVDWSEFYLDLSLYFSDNYASSSPEEIEDILKEIKGKINEEMNVKEGKSNKSVKLNQLALGMGLGSNKVIARFASIQSLIQHNRIIIVPNDIKAIGAFTSSIPICSIPFLSERTKSQLKDLNISTCKDILAKQVELFYVFEIKFNLIVSIALGIGPDEHEEVKLAKPIEFHQAIANQKDIGAVFNSLIAKVANELKEGNFKGQTLTLEILNDCKKKIKRSLTLEKSFQSEKELKVNGEKLLRELVDRAEKICVLRVRLSALTRKSEEEKDNAISEWFQLKKSKRNVNVIKFNNNEINEGSKGLKQFLSKAESKSRSKSAHMNVFKNTLSKPVVLKTPKRRSKQKKTKPKFTLDSFLILK